MKRNLILFYIPIVLAFTLSAITIEIFTPTNAQIDPSQEEIEPIPPSNTTNPDNIPPMANALSISEI